MCDQFCRALDTFCVIAHAAHVLIMPRNQDIKQEQATYLQITEVVASLHGQATRQKAADIEEILFLSLIAGITELC